MNDEELIAAFYACDGAALGELVTRYGPRLVRVFTGRGISRELAEDGAQQVWLRVIETKSAGSVSQRFDPTRGVPLLPWLLTIARNVAVDLLRRGARLPAQMPVRTEGAGSFEETLSADIDPVDTRLLTDEVRDIIRICADELPQDERDVLALEMTRCGLIPKPNQRDWAQQHGLTPTEFISRLHRARGRMAECLRRRLPDEPLT